MWNHDDLSPHVESYKLLYKSIPFLIAMRKKKPLVFSLIIPLNHTLIWVRKIVNTYYFGAVDGNLDYYFIYG